MKILVVFPSLVVIAMGQSILPANWEHWPAFVPLLGGVSSPCLDQSLNIIQALTGNGDSSDTQWAWKMIDSTGKFPRDGTFSNIVEQTIDLCDMMEGFKQGFDCQTIPEYLRTFTLKIPNGHSKSPGTIDECLKIEKVETKYCRIYFWAAKYSQYVQIPDKFDSKLSKILSKFPAMEQLKQNPILSTKMISDYNKKVDISLLNTFERDMFNGTILDIFSNQIYGILQKSCPQCLKTTGIADQLPMYLALLWLQAQGQPGQAWFGGCYSSACTGEDIRLNYESYAQRFHAGKLSVGTFTGESQCVGKDRQPKAFRTNHQWSIQSKVIVPIFCVLAFLIVVGTCVDVWSRVNPYKQDLPFSESGAKPGGSFLMKIMKSFSLYSNVTILLSTQTGGRDVITCLHGLRFLSMSWVVLSHTLLITLYTAPLDNSSIFIKVLSGGFGVAFEAILNGFPSVDTFFLLSGFLVAYLTFKELDRTNGILNHIILIILYYVHRYIRLTIPLGLIMLIVIGITPLFATGISWSGSAVGEADSCVKHWKAHIGYYNNENDGEANGCMGVTWYMADDMMFYWISPLLMYPMWTLTKYLNKVGIFLSVCLWSLVLAVFTGYRGYLMWYNKVGINGNNPIEGWREWRHHDDFYSVWYTRIQPYLVGLMLGYILHLLRGKPFKLNPIVNIVMWQLSFLVAYTIVFGWFDLRTTGEGTIWLVVAYNTFQRLAWGLCVGWVIFSCSKGYGGPVNDFLSWKFFGPLSKLTYCCYLVHMNVMSFFFGTINFSYDFTWWNYVISFVGSLSLSLSVAFILTLTVELPFIFVEKLLVGKLLEGIKSMAYTAKNGRENKTKEHPQGMTGIDSHKVNVKEKTEEKKDLTKVCQNEEVKGLPVADEVLSVD